MDRYEWHGFNTRRAWSVTNNVVGPVLDDVLGVTVSYLMSSKSLHFEQPDLLRRLYFQRLATLTWLAAAYNGSKLNIGTRILWSI